MTIKLLKLVSHMTRIPIMNIMEHRALVSELFDIRVVYIQKATIFEHQLSHAKNRMLNNTMYYPIYLRLVSHLNVEKHKLNAKYKAAVGDSISQYMKDIELAHNEAFFISLARMTKMFCHDVM